MNELTNVHDIDKSSPFDEWDVDPFLKDLNPRETDDLVDPLMCGNESDEVSMRNMMAETIDFPDPTPCDFDFDVKNASLTSESNTTSTSSDGNRKRKSSSGPRNQSCGSTISRRKKKPKAKPKRALSAYNIFFQAERSQILAKAECKRSKIGFEELAKIIGKKWAGLTKAQKNDYDTLAEEDRVRYRKEMDAYNDKMNKTLEGHEKISAGNLSRLLSVPALPEAQPFASSNSLHQVQSRQPQAMFSLQSTCGTVQHEEILSQLNLLSRSPIEIPCGYVVPSGMALQMLIQTQYDSIRRPLMGQYDGSHQIHLPPAVPSAGIEQAVPPNAFQLPPGFEIVLRDQNGIDRMHCVKYTCYSMTRDAAHKYVERITGATAAGSSHADMQIPYQHPLEAMQRSQETGQQDTPQTLHLPPICSGVDLPTPPNSFPMPPGYEVVLSDRNGIDRKYRMQYTCLSMARDAAREYEKSFTGATATGRSHMMPNNYPSPQCMTAWGGFL